MADRYRDFDSALVEEGKSQVTFMIGGRDYTLPSDIPAEVILVHMRRLQDDGSVPRSAMADWLTALVGEKNLRRMFDDGVTWPQVENLLRWLLDEYGLAGADVEEAEDAVEDDSGN